jgi:hypothetical protein
MAVRVLLMLVVLMALYGCGQPTSSAPEQGGKDAGEKPESTPKPEPTGIQASSEFHEWNCRAETYVTQQNMSEAQRTAFGVEMVDRLAEDVRVDGHKHMEDILDDMGVPAYEEACQRG